MAVTDHLITSTFVSIICVGHSGGGELGQGNEEEGWRVLPGVEEGYGRGLLKVPGFECLGLPSTANARKKPVDAS